MSFRDLLRELEEGRAVKIVIDGDGASMRGIVKHGMLLTLSPVLDFHDVKAGDIALIKWRNDNHILHLVKEIQNDQYLIVNSFGKVNGWVLGTEIIGRVTEMQDTGEQDIATIVQTHEATSRVFIF
jgi:hypothetical protein